jgi:excisionase family DNA binding protein
VGPRLTMAVKIFKQGDDMEATITTATAAHQAHVTASTIRAWCRAGVIAAAKTGRRWIIEAASLRHRIAVGRRTVTKQLAAFRDATGAETKALELIETGALIPAPRRGLYLAVSSDATDRYLIDLAEGSCTCKGYAHTGHCYHLLAAVMVETGAGEAE